MIFMQMNAVVQKDFFLNLALNEDQNISVNIMVMHIMMRLSFSKK